MTKSEVVAHFGSIQAVADALGIKYQSVYGWSDNGVPLGRQWQLQAMTKGKLKVTPAPKKYSA